MAFIVPCGQLSKDCSMAVYLNSKLGMLFLDSFTIIPSPTILRRLHGALEVSSARPSASRAVSAASSNTLKRTVSAKNVRNPISGRRESLTEVPEAHLWLVKLHLQLVPLQT